MMGHLCGLRSAARPRGPSLGIPRPRPHRCRGGGVAPVGRQSQANLGKQLEVGWVSAAVLTRAGLSETPGASAQCPSSAWPHVRSV